MADLIVLNLPMILCLLFGTALLIVEAFMPGFGIAGISGAILEIVAIVLMYLHHGLVPAVILTVVLLCLLTVLIILSLHSIKKGRLSKSSVVLKEEEHAGSAPDHAALLGKTGTAVTTLRPAGIVELDGERLNVVTEGEFIPGGSSVRVISTNGTKITVRREEK